MIQLQLEKLINFYFFKILTFPQFKYSTAVSLKKKYTKSPRAKELTKFGAENEI